LSSILRALKKLESDPRHLEDTPFLDNKFVPLADTSPQKTPARLIMMVFGGGTVCGFVILAGWWLFAEKNDSPSPAPQETALQNVRPMEVVPAISKEAETPERSVPAVAPEKPVAKNLAPRKTANTVPVPGAIPVQRTLPSPPVVEHKAVMPLDEPVPEPAPQKATTTSPEINTAVPVQKAAAAVTRPPEVSRAAREIETPVLNDPKMRLQAITWSKDPQKRIVVINNRILRQGEAVSGYRIDTINQDDVLLSDAGEKWKLVFRIK
jgi:hypothetical protein